MLKIGVAVKLTALFFVNKEKLKRCDTKIS